MMMKNFITLCAAFVLSLTMSDIAAAQSMHGDDADGPNMATGPNGDGQTHMMQNMMKMMMRMHAGMMGGESMDMMGAGGTPGMTMMDRNMMKMMMGPDMMGRASADDAASTMQSRLAEFDADSNGSLSLAEFETLHAAMIAETTVDRFQHLDADGDGQITESEMSAPARRMEMHEMMQQGSSMPSGSTGGGGEN
jgi:hypothetical protein